MGPVRGACPQLVTPLQGLEGLHQLTPSLEGEAELGLRVLGTLSGDSRFGEIQTMHRSEVNMMVCSRR